MTGLGDRLKEARKLKGYSLDDLQEITKIQKRYLAAIENEEYKTMPGSFYVRAFIKQYAEAVDLNAEEMLALYKDDKDTQKVEEEERQQLAAPPLTRTRSRGSSQLNEVMPKIIVALFIIVIILVIAFLWRHKAPSNPEIPTGTETPIQVEDKGKPKDQAPSTDKDDEEDETDGEGSDDGASDDANDNQDEVNQTLTHIQVVGQDSMYELEGADSFKLEIRTTGPSWIGVTDQTGKELSPEATTMDAGEKLELDVSDVEKVRIRVGRTGEAEIYVNGEKLTYATDAITQNIHIEYKK